MSSDQAKEYIELLAGTPQIQKWILESVFDLNYESLEESMWDKLPPDLDDKTSIMLFGLTTKQYADFYLLEQEQNLGEEKLLSEIEKIKKSIDINALYFQSDEMLQFFYEELYKNFQFKLGFTVIN